MINPPDKSESQNQANENPVDSKFTRDALSVLGGTAYATIKAYFNQVNQVLKYAFKHDYSDRLLWFDLDFGGVGRPSRRLILLVPEVWKLFSPRDTMINKKSLKVHSLF